jgi:membrane protease YdiL (CAAX protease family)
MEEIRAEGSGHNGNEDMPGRYRRYVRRMCSWLGWALTAGLVISTGIGLIFSYFELDYVPAPVVTLIGYGAAAPAFFMLLFRVPVSVPEKKKMRLRKFIMFYVLAQGLGYVFSILGNLINLAVAAGTGRDVFHMNPVNSMLLDLDWIMILYITVLGPVIEEYIFRGFLLNRLRPFGEKAAVLFSALAFGLFHGNLTQALYATAIGLILGYAAVKTGRMLYNCLLHILINSGSTLLALNLNGSLIWQLIISTATLFAMGAFIIAAIVILCLNARRARLAPGEWPAGVSYRDFASAMYVNPGMMCFIILNVILIGLYLFL